MVSRFQMRRNTSPPATSSGSTVDPRTVDMYGFPLGEGEVRFDSLAIGDTFALVNKAADGDTPCTFLFVKVSNVGVNVLTAGVLGFYCEMDAGACCRRMGTYIPEE